MKRLPDYEVLVVTSSEAVHWVPCKEGKVPCNAVIGGTDCSFLEPYFVGRTKGPLEMGKTWRGQRLKAVSVDIVCYNRGLIYELACFDNNQLNCSRTPLMFFGSRKIFILIFHIFMQEENPIEIQKFEPTSKYPIFHGRPKKDQCRLTLNFILGTTRPPQNEH